MAGLLDFINDEQSRRGMIANMRNMAQSASNTVAGNIAGPVDLAAWGLRKIGVPVGDAPVGGTEWGKRVGLLGYVKPGASAIAGETFGLLAPMVAAAKAPEIARGLLQMGANAMAPRTLNPQTGAVVWHGSPHKFNKFDSSKIGTGEGAQAYGHGLYLAESPEVASSYQKMLAEPAIDGKSLSELGYSKKAIDTVKYTIANADHLRAERFAQQGVPEYVQAVDALKKINGQAGSLYKVDLPDEAIAKMLDWDKPLSQQPKGVAEALSLIAEKKNPTMARYWKESVGLDEAAKNELRRKLGINIFDAIDQGGAAYQSLGQKNIEDALTKAGVPGIRYLDGGSRGAGQGTSNYVVFPGNENLLTILERNGQPIGLLD